MKLFEKFKVFTKAELDSRVEIVYETYSKEINIEARAAIDIATKQIIPAVIKYTTVLAESITSVKAACGADVSAQTEILTQVSSILAASKKACKITGSNGKSCRDGRRQRSGCILQR